MSLGKAFIHEFVLAFGFFGGLFARIGVDPEGTLIRAMGDVVTKISPNSGFGLFFWIIPIALTLASIFGAFVMGGPVGLLAVGIAALAGYFIQDGIGVWLLFAAVILGLVAPYTVNNRN